MKILLPMLLLFSNVALAQVPGFPPPPPPPPPVGWCGQTFCPPLPVAPTPLPNPPGPAPAPVPAPQPAQPAN